MTLRHKTFAAVRWTTVAAVARAALQLAQVAVLARLLAPEDYGLMAMVWVVTGFAAIFSDLGVNSAFIQCQSVTPEQRSSLFWLNVIVSVGLTVVVLAFSPLLARFFADERLTPLLRIAAPTFVIAALGMQVRMAAEKALHFRPVVVVETSAAILGFATAVACAMAGIGVYALVFGALMTALVQTAFFWMVLARGWRPMFRLQVSEVRPFIGFGGALVANNIVNYINGTVDLLLGGRLLTAAALGMYSLPRNLVLQLQAVINPIITRVGFPLIAQVQNDIPKVRSIYLQTLNMTASTNAPLYLGIAFFAPEIVAVMFGERWAGTVEVMRILTLWGFVRSTGNPLGSLLLGMGRADLSLKWNLGLLCFMPPVLWLASRFGTIGLAWALFAVQCVLFIPGWFFLVRPLCEARLLEYLGVTLNPFLLACAAIGPAYWLSGCIENTVLRLALAVTVAVPLYLLASWLMNRAWIEAMRSLLLPKRAVQQA